MIDRQIDHRSRGTPFDKCGAHSGLPQLFCSYILPHTQLMFITCIYNVPDAGQRTHIVERCFVLDIMTLAAYEIAIIL